MNGCINEMVDERMDGINEQMQCNKVKVNDKMKQHHDIKLYN